MGLGAVESAALSHTLGQVGNRSKAYFGADCGEEDMLVEVPTVPSKKRVQASHPGDTALSAPTADYEFHPTVRIDRPRLRERAADSAAPNPVRDPQGGNCHEGF